MKKQIDIYDYADHILKYLKKGILITTKNDDKINSMTISWGQLGIVWNRLIFTAYIRQGRFTHEILKKTNEFTINIPMNEKAGKILSYCGTKSGRDYHKVKELGLTPVYGENISVPGIKELPLTLECRLIYSQLQDKNLIPEFLKQEFYPRDVHESFHGLNKNFDTMFMGEIVGAYIAL